MNLNAILNQVHEPLNPLINQDSPKFSDIVSALLSFLCWPSLVFFIFFTSPAFCVNEVLFITVLKKMVGPVSVVGSSVENWFCKGVRLVKKHVPYWSHIQHLEKEYKNKI